MSVINGFTAPPMLKPLIFKTSSPLGHKLTSNSPAVRPVIVMNMGAHWPAPEKVNVCFIRNPCMFGVDKTVWYWLCTPFSARLFLEERKKSVNHCRSVPSKTYCTVSSVEKQYCGLMGQTGRPSFASETRSSNNLAPSLILFQRSSGHSFPIM